jgi:hypothetical protein
MKRIAVVSIAVVAFIAGINTGYFIEGNKIPPVVNVTVNPVSAVDPIYNCIIETYDEKITHIISVDKFTLTATQIINMKSGDKVGNNSTVSVPLWNTKHNEMMGLIETENSFFNCVLS